jgi:hypothetical protein
MKTALISAASALVLASVWSTSSFAQQYNDDDGYQTSHRDRAHYRNDYDQPAGRQDDEDRDQDRGRDRPADAGPTYFMPMMGERAGAHFQLSRGDTHIDIRCPRNETLQNCVQAAGQLIDKVQSLTQGSAGGKPDTGH